MHNEVNLKKPGNDNGRMKGNHKASHHNVYRVCTLLS